MSRQPREIIMTFKKGHLINSKMSENITKNELLKAISYLAERAAQ